MADSVQYVLDRMSGLFRQLQELEIFTSEEVASIVKKRTDFEYVMKRRQLFIEDFYGYLQYEVNLEKLRVARCKRLEQSGKFGAEDKGRKDAMRNVSSLCSRHICSVFDRATRRYPNNMDIWADYIAYLKDSKSTTILNTVFGKALSLHPRNEDFWIQAAVHELEENNNVHAARVLFQRALRTNKTSQKLWLRYFELELWNSTKIIERNSILGLESANSTSHREALFGAPVVVFKHAIVALSDLDVALDMFRDARGLQDGEFVATLQRQMQEKFGGKAVFWGALIRLSEEDTASSTTPLSTTEAQNDPLKKKRKMSADETVQEAGGGSMAVLVAAVTQRVQQTLRLLQEGKEALTDKTEIESFALVEGSTINDCLVRALTALRNVLNSDQGPKKKGKVVASSSSSSSSSSSKATDVTVPGLDDLFQVLGAAIDKFAGINLSGAPPSCDIRLHLSVCTAGHQLFHIVNALKNKSPKAKVPSSLTKASVDCGQLAEQLKATATFMKTDKALKASTASVGSSAWTAQMKIVEHWCTAFAVCFASCKDRRDLLRKSKDTGNKDREAAQSIVRSLADAGLAVASLVLRYGGERGEECLSATLKALEVVSTSEKISNDYWRTIISSSSFHGSSTRGDWCAQYLDWCLQPSLVIGQQKALPVAYAWVETVVKASASATHGGDMTQFHAFALNAQLAAFNEHLSHTTAKTRSADIVAFTRAVVEKAATACPQEKSFWESWEDVERKLNNHAGANHVRWRRDQEGVRDEALN